GGSNALRHIAGLLRYDHSVQVVPDSLRIIFEESECHVEGGRLLKMCFSGGKVTSSHCFTSSAQQLQCLCLLLVLHGQTSSSSVCRWGCFRSRSSRLHHVL